MQKYRFPRFHNKNRYHLWYKNIKKKKNSNVRVLERLKRSVSEFKFSGYDCTRTCLKSILGESGGLCCVIC